ASLRFNSTDRANPASVSEGESTLFSGWPAEEQAHSPQSVTINAIGFAYKSLPEKMGSVPLGNSLHPEHSIPRALVVENDLVGRELLARVLRQKGFDAQTAIGAAQAADVLLNAGFRFDLLLVDLNLEPIDEIGRAHV